MLRERRRLVILGGIAVLLACVAAWRLLAGGSSGPDDPTSARIRQYQEEKDIPALGRAVDDDDAKTAWLAVRALGQIRSADVLPHIERAMDDSRDVVRAEAATAFGLRCSPGQAGRLVPLCSDGAAQVRAAAVAALGTLRAYDHMDAVLKAVADRDSFVRRRAIAAAERIAGRELGVKPGASLAECREAAQKLKAAWPGMLDAAREWSQAAGRDER